MLRELKDLCCDITHEFPGISQGGILQFINDTSLLGIPCRSYTSKTH